MRDLFVKPIVSLLFIIHCKNTFPKHFINNTFKRFLRSQSSAGRVFFSELMIILRYFKIVVIISLLNRNSSLKISKYFI